MGDERSPVGAQLHARSNGGDFSCVPGHGNDHPPCFHAWFAGPEGPPALFAGRVLPFDEKAALVWASLMADSKATGRSRNALDAIIAATARANDCVVVTDNERDFVDVKIINPLRITPP